MKLEVYFHAGEWKWRLLHDGRDVGGCAKGFERRIDCLEATRLLQTHGLVAEIIDAPR